MENNNLKDKKVFKNIWYSTLNHQDTLKQKLELGRWRAFLAPWKYIVFVDSGKLFIERNSITFFGKKAELKISKIEKVSRYMRSGKAPINYCKYEWIRIDYRTDKNVRKTALFLVGSHGIKLATIISKTNELYKAILIWKRDKEGD